MTDATERFRRLVCRGGDNVRLDEAALLLAAHARPGLDVDAGLAALDGLAAGCRGGGFEGWRRHLFDDLGFRGAVQDYDDPDNSFLDQVLARRRGIPISLSVLGMEVGRRVGVPLVGVGMPGHFLLGRPDAPGVFVDPFHGGAVLDRAGCAALFARVHGPGARPAPRHLAPVGPRAILVRMLANLEASYAGRGDETCLEWVLLLRLCLPGAPEDVRDRLVRVLAGRGRFGEAGRRLEEWADAPGADRSGLRRRALEMRARLN